MKKLLILLVVLIATPVFAALSVDMNDLGSGVVAIEYKDANALNLPRAFALEFTVDAPATITLTEGSYKKDGVNEFGDPCGFGIYPARIIVEADGTVIPGNYGNPLADPCDPYPGDGDGSGNVVLEFGSLYDGDANAPGTSGTLCTLTIDCNDAVVDVNLTMVDEDLIRGGVLLEDGTPVAVDQTILITCEDPDPDAGTCWDPAECPLQAQGDSNCDGDVNLDDLIALKKSWNKGIGDAHGTGVGEYNCCADFNKSGVSQDVVNLDDLIALKIGWPLAPQTSTGNQTCPPGH